MEKKKKNSQKPKAVFECSYAAFIHSAVLADNPVPRSTLSRWHGVALEDSIFNPLGTGSAKQEVERMLGVRRQSGHFRLAQCCVGHWCPTQHWAYHKDKRERNESASIRRSD